MGLSRRTTIIGIGTLAVGAGVIGGSGAFDSVEANRSFEVGVTGDASALLSLVATNDTIADTQSGGAGGNDIIYFTLTDNQGNAASLNDNALNEFFEVMEVTNNGNQTVTLTMELDVAGVEFLVNLNENDPIVDLATDGYTLNPGDSVSVDLRIDTENGGYQPPQGSPHQVTIRAVA